MVDNGSVDKTIAIAEKRGARVLVKPGLTISQLRNAGCRAATGEVLVFVDGDVYLKATWGNRFREVLQMLDVDPMLITGSLYGLRDNPSWIEKFWFGPVLGKTTVNYINGGHLILRKDLFRKVGGFCESLETGEDWEFCQRAKKRGATISNIPDLKVVHEGYPTTLYAFFRRERWHGLGDFGSVREVLSSTPALLSIIQLVVILLSVILAVQGKQPTFLLAYVVFMGVVCVLAAARRCGRSIRHLPACTFLYVFYFWARTFSLFDVIRNRDKGERKVLP